MDDFRPDLFDRARRLVLANNSNHPWAVLHPEELLKKAGFYRQDPYTGQKGFSIASALTFGTDEIIHSIVPAYNFDALVRRKNLDRYDDHLTVRTNLIEAYDLLMDFVAKHLDDPFFLKRIFVSVCRIKFSESWWPISLPTGSIQTLGPQP